MNLITQGIIILCIILRHCPLSTEIRCNAKVFTKPRDSSVIGLQTSFARSGFQACLPQNYLGAI